MRKPLTMSQAVVLLLCAVMCFPPLFAQQPRKIDKAGKTEVITKTAAFMRDYYILPDVGKAMADHIEQLHRKNSYGTFTEIAPFCRKVTSDLREISHDKHLYVFYSPEEARMVAAKENLLPEDQVHEIQKEGLRRKQRKNFGFKQVRILEGNIGYLELTTFSHIDQAGPTAVAAMQLLSHTDAIILDLRENHGGSETMTQLIMSYFFGSKPMHLINTYYREGDREKQTWTMPYVPGSKLTDTDLYILTSGRSASAAEEVAFNLKNLNRAVIVGEITRGAANPITVKIIKGDILSQISIGSVANPETGATWEQVGVEPDIAVAAEDAFQTAYITALKKLAEACSDRAWKKHLETLYMEKK